MPYKDKEKLKAWRNINKERLNEQQKIRNDKNKERRKVRYDNNKELLLTKRKEYVEKNKELVKEQKKRSYLKYKHKNNEKSREYYSKNRDRLVKQKTKYILNKCLNDSTFKMKRLISRRFALALKLYTKNGKTNSLKEYGIDIKSIIEQLGQPPQDGKKYHIDHIFPIVAFDLENPEHIKLCWHPSNLQWLEASENIKKSDKYDLNEFIHYINNKGEA